MQLEKIYEERSKAKKEEKYTNDNLNILTEKIHKQKLEKKSFLASQHEKAKNANELVELMFAKTERQVLTDPHPPLGVFLLSLL